mgnify:CR=1 FL=1
MEWVRKLGEWWVYLVFESDYPFVHEQMMKIFALVLKKDVVYLLHLTEESRIGWEKLGGWELRS